MAVENLKSLGIANLDATPYVMNATGVGAIGNSKQNDGYATVSAAASLTSTYQLCRVPTNIKVKNVWFEAAAMGAGKFQIGVYYSDSKIDGTAPSNQGVVVSANFFANDIDCTSAVSQQSVVNQSGNYPINSRQLPLWKALGLTSDPGGMFDIVATVHTTAVTTGTALIYARADYIL